MAMLSADQRDLILPLIEGICENPPWAGFMRNLAARMQARHACMVITLANAPPYQAPAVIHAVARHAAGDDPVDLRRLNRLRLRSLGTLRPGRVYALDEMLDYDDRAHLAAQREGLAAMGIGYGRWLRVGAGVADAWLVMVREREDFSGSAVAVLDAVAAHLTAGLRTLAALADQRLHAALASSALGRLGIGQIAFDRDGRVMAADAVAQAVLTLVPAAGGRPGRRLHLRADAARALDAACATLAADENATPCVISIDALRGVDLLLRRADLILAEPDARPAVIGLLREPLREPARAAIRTLAAHHGLSANEAALAHGLSLGESLAEAGARLHLTEATARNYSKRIYAKTGARGQGDLVRLVLTGLAPLA